MADKKFTFFELHLDEGSIQFGPSRIGDVGDLKGADDEAEGDAESGGRESHCPGGKAGKFLLVLVVLLVVAVGAKKRFGGGTPSDLDELDELAE